ncbi:MAG: hypothetical protein IH899_09990, partial [Planctomycetes bacterium]|nr:hypothetical protein [Planctomycetota bacterium]
VERSEPRDLGSHGDRRDRPYAVPFQQLGDQGVVLGALEEQQFSTLRLANVFPLASITQT